MDMFCYQCQEAARNEGCATRGICGKTPEVAALQDLLVWLLKGLSYYALRAGELGLSDPRLGAFIEEALFATITNANFDAQRFVGLAEEGLRLRDSLRERFLAAYRQVNGRGFAGVVPEAADWRPERADLATLVAQGRQVGIRADTGLNEDIRSLRELLFYGLKGMAAYAEHARVLGYTDPDVAAFMQEALAATLDDSLTADDLVALVQRCGAMGVRVMALLDRANTATYGQPEPTWVELGVREGPAILVSGHDLRDLDELLQQTAGTGVNVYTHGEMLPAHAYPTFRKYPHLVGNYGGSWWRQQDEFERFGGAILLTTNCLVPPRLGYRDRLFTTGPAGWPGVPHIADRQDGAPKDFSPLIARALELGSPQPLEEGRIPIGFAHAAVLRVADRVIEAVQSGAIKRFVVMAGCDGRQKAREYYTDVAKALPRDAVILTAGCAKYRYNKLDLGEIGGIPRVLDAGQCNDSYSLVVVALKLAEALGLEDINALPISYDIAWYEQKAVIVLLALLSLNVRHIRLGPTLPAFVSPGVLKVLVERFDIQPITRADADVAALMAGD
jgi:hydroxylamine reductase